jgi:hypothetical protein
VEDFRVLQLSDNSVILGCDWLKKHNPVAFDFHKKIFTMHKFGRYPVTFPTCTAQQQVIEISAEKMDKLLSKNCSGFIIQLNTLSASSDSNTEQLPEISQLLMQFSDVFAEPTELPPHRSCDHSIHLKDGAIPPALRPYRVPHRQKSEVEKQIQELLSKKLIRTSQSAYASPIILVNKKDSSQRLCVDFRKLNAQTVKNKFPIPIIEDLLDELHGAQVFSKLDLRSGYHQIRMRPEDIHKTAFRTFCGHFEYLVMPFGLSNAPATFQALMNDIFKNYLRNFVLVFFDDILVYSPDLQTHLSHLSTVLHLLRANNLYAKQSKCVFAVPQVEYLGHVISGQGVATDPKKIAAIAAWQSPASVTQLRSFLGLSGYYRRFISGYSLICRPLHDLLKKGLYTWQPEHENAFQTLKQALTTAPVLALPNFSEPFILETDASGSGLGAVLMQKGRAIAYYSTALGPRNAALSVYEKEALAILESLKRWRHYFLGGKLIIRSDHQSLKFITDQRVSEGIQHKLMLKLLEHDYSVEYKKGSANRAADALSRQYSAVNTISVV